jgi:peptidoglycan/xylan/chitin deacetylase (PgdA/CDA1 family)
MKPESRRLVSLGTGAALAACAAARAMRGDLRGGHRCAVGVLAGVLLPTLLPGCAWFGPVLRRLPGGERRVWLTIDDGPDPRDTPELLEVLDRHAAHATFFVIGRKVRMYPEAARAVVAAGHRLENHTWSHPASRFWAAPPSFALSEIREATAAIREVGGPSPAFFRAPAGLANPFVHAAAARTGLRIAGWSASGYDGVRHDPERVIGRILSVLRPGSVVLLHEGPLPGIEPGTRARTLARLLRELDKRGYATAPGPA